MTLPGSSQAAPRFVGQALRMSSRPLFAITLATVGILLAACGSSPASSSPSTTASSPGSGAAASTSAPASGDPIVPTPETTEPASTIECQPGATLVEQTEGPYYTPGAPERTDVTDGAPGTPLLVTGYVLDSSCSPIAGATVDVWQADGNGTYDNSGFVLRGIQTTGADGGYTLTTVIPGQYPGRTEHIHVKVTAPDGPTFTTQLYFPGSEANGGDRIYVPEMEIAIDSFDESSMRAHFNFVLPG